MHDLEYPTHHLEILALNLTLEECEQSLATGQLSQAPQLSQDGSPSDRLESLGQSEQHGNSSALQELDHQVEPGRELIPLR